MASATATDRADILVVTDREITRAIAEAVRSETIRIARGRKPLVRLVAPELVRSQAKRLAGEVDQASDPAVDRLAASVETLRSVGIAPASFALGDEDPVLAVGDELRRSNCFEHVIVVPCDEGHLAQERHFVSRLSDEIDVPVTEIEPGESGVAVIHGEARNREDWADATEIGAVIAGVVGSIALIILAGVCVADGSGSAKCIAVQALAILFGLINVGNLVAMLMMSSVPYRGRVRTAITALSGLGTPLAAALSGLLVLT